MKLKRDDMVFHRKGHILAVKCMDKRDMLALCTKRRATSISVNFGSTYDTKEVVKPDTNLDYNIHKTGVVTVMSY